MQNVLCTCIQILSADLRKALMIALMKRRCCSQSGAAYKLFALSMFWCLGTLIGYMLYQDSNASCFQFVQLIPYSKASFLGLFCVIYLPFLLMLFAAYYSVDFLTYFLVFFKSSTFVFVGCLVYGFYQSAGWLMHGLVLLSTSVSAILQFLFLCYYFLNGKTVIKRWAAQYVLITLVLFIFDYFILSRFIQTLSY